MKVNTVTLVVVIIVLVGTVVLTAVLLGRKTCGEPFKKGKCDMEGEKNGKMKMCCIGCTKCADYTKEGKLIMDSELYMGLPRSSMIMVTGKLVDMRCYSQNYRNHTDDHVTATGGIMKNCGAACMKLGVPCGILEGGKPGNPLYVLLIASPVLVDYIDRKAAVRGRLMRDSGALFPVDFQAEGKDGKMHNLMIGGKAALM